jgi:hypothetical protein
MTGPAFRLDPPEPPPRPTREQASRAATEALRLMDAGAPADGPVVHQPSELNTALDPLRLHPALGVRCGRLTCGRGLGYVALDPNAARLMSGNRRQPPSKRRGGIDDLADISPHSGRFEGWVQDSEDRRGSVRVTGEAPGQRAGLPQRRTYHCTGCGADYTLTNSRLLTLYLEAVERGDHEFRVR